MTKSALWMVALAALSGDALLAQDLTGTWQGTLAPPERQGTAGRHQGHQG